ncbi:MAG: hypothetical protein ACI9QC_000030 [Oceanicoccus sp.]|jgi:hypothetical protein
MMDPLTRRVKPLKNRTRRKPLSVEVQSTYRMIVFLLLLIGGASMALFLYTNSLKPVKGYTLKQLQINYENLSAESRTWDHRVIEAQSFINLEEDAVVNEMEEMNENDFSYATSDFGYAYNE